MEMDRKNASEDLYMQRHHEVNEISQGNDSINSTKSDVLNYRFQQKRGKKAQNLSDYNEHVLDKIE